MSEDISRSWFCVLNNPDAHGYTSNPEEVLEQLKQEWIDSGKSRKGYWAYCISSTGLKHVHMVLEGSGAMRFSAVKKVYGSAHLEPTKGGKKQVLAYIKKEPPFSEKGEEVIAFISHGLIEGNNKYPLSNRNDVMLKIQELIDDGKTPNEIMDLDIRLRKEETLIRKAYFRKRFNETPPVRDVKVIWHLGGSGVGKSYSYIKLCEEFGDDNIYFFTDYANKSVGGFDAYGGEYILFMDELKPNALPFELLLTLLQGYRSQLHCRFNNAYALWEEVHITSVYSPEQIYDASVKSEYQEVDTIKQLLRRITRYIYHYKDGNQFKEFSLSGEEYVSYEDLKSRVDKLNKEHFNE